MPYTKPADTTSKAIRPNFILFILPNDVYYIDMNMFKGSNSSTVEEYIASLKEPRRSEILRLHELIRKTVPNLKPHIQSGMLGYGTYHYKYASGKEGDWMIIGLSSRKNYISLYVNVTTPDGQYVAENYQSSLPNASIGKSCIRFKKLEDIEQNTLARVIKQGAELLA